MLTVVVVGVSVGISVGGSVGDSVGTMVGADDGEGDPGPSGDRVGPADGESVADIQASGMVLLVTPVHCPGPLQQVFRTEEMVPFPNLPASRQDSMPLQA